MPGGMSTASATTARRAVSIIAFIGSVFSPWYRWSGRRDPQNHVCLNVATYGPGGRFTMTDRGRPPCGSRATASDRPLGGALDRAALVIDINEMGRPAAGAGAVRGPHRGGADPAIGRDGIEVALTPGRRASLAALRPHRADRGRPDPGPVAGGHGYFDANFGTRALEADFASGPGAAFRRSGRGAGAGAGGGHLRHRPAPVPRRVSLPPAGHPGARVLRHRDWRLARARRALPRARW
jgi:hypothetical protein